MTATGHNHNEAALIETAVEHLGTVGYSVCVDLLPPELVVSLRAEQRRREDGGELAVAKVGRGGASQAHGANLRQAQSSGSTTNQWPNSNLWHSPNGCGWRSIAT
jgi:hypothetical protein